MVNFLIVRRVITSELSDVFSQTKAVFSLARVYKGKNLKFKTHLGVYKERVPLVRSIVYFRAGSETRSIGISLVSIMLRHNKPRY